MEFHILPKIWLCLVDLMYFVYILIMLFTCYRVRCLNSYLELNDSVVLNQDKRKPIILSCLQVNSRSVALETCLLLANLAYTKF